MFLGFFVHGRTRIRVCIILVCHARDLMFCVNNHWTFIIINVSIVVKAYIQVSSAAIVGQQLV